MKKKSPARLTAEIKKTLGPVTGPIQDKDVADWFNYKNLNSYASSSKKPWIENGLLSFLDRVKDNFILIPKDRGALLIELFEDLERRLTSNEEITEEEKELLELIKNQTNEN